MFSHGFTNIPKSVWACSLLFIAVSVDAQNTGGVFGPVVNDGHQSAQYRGVFDPDSDALAQRAHYQKSLNDDLMARVVLQSRKTSDRTVDFDFMQGELTWQLSDNAADWQYGLRFDLRVRHENRPDLFGLHFTNQVKVAPRVSLRGILLTSAEFGENSRSGIFLNSRSQVNYKADSNLNTGIEMFSAYGKSTDINGFNDQQHQLGPYISVALDNRWSLSSGMLFGLTDSTPDVNIRIFLGRSF